MHRRGFSRILILVIVAVAVIAIGGAIFYRQKVSEPPVADVNLQTKVLATIPPDVEMKWFWLSEDGRRVAYLGKRAGKEFISIDGVKGPSYDSLSVYGAIGQFEFSPDGRSYAYHVAKNGNSI